MVYSVTTPECVEVTTATKAVDSVDEQVLSSHEVIVTKVVVSLVVFCEETEVVLLEIDPLVDDEPDELWDTVDSVAVPDDVTPEELELSVAVNGHQVVYSVTTPKEVVVATETKAGDVEVWQALSEHEVTVTIVVSLKTFVVNDVLPLFGVYVVLSPRRVVVPFVIDEVLTNEPEDVEPEAVEE